MDGGAGEIPSVVMTPFELESLKRQEIERFHDLALEEEARKAEVRRRWAEEIARNTCPYCGHCLPID